MITARLNALGEIEETPADASLAIFNFSHSKKLQHLAATPRLNLVPQFAVCPAQTVSLVIGRSVADRP